MTALDLDAIRKRAEAATAGPWKPLLRATDGTHDNMVEMSSGSRVVTTRRGDDSNDILFIAHAYEDISNMLAEIDRLQQYEGVAMSAVGVEIGGERYYVKPNVAAEIDRLTRQLAEARATIRAIAGGCINSDFVMSNPPDWHRAFSDLQKIAQAYTAQQKELEILRQSAQRTHYHLSASPPPTLMEGEGITGRLPAPRL